MENILPLDFLKPDLPSYLRQHVNVDQRCISLLAYRSQPPLAFELSPAHRAHAGYHSISCC